MKKGLRQRSLILFIFGQNLLQVFDTGDKFFFQFPVLFQLFGFRVDKLFRRFCDKAFVVEHAFAPCDFLVHAVKFLIKPCDFLIGVDKFAKRDKDFGVRGNECTL